jgi:hypothetical protein
VNRTTISVSASAAPFRTGVSLHSHTLYSRETLSFIYQLARAVPAIRSALARGEATYSARRASTLDLNRAWWTPPLSPHQAWQLEKLHIEQLDASAIVSLTDHDDVCAALSLRVMEECRGVPISTEWTVPYEEAFFHIGVHSIPPARTREFKARMGSITRKMGVDSVGGILRDLNACGDTLIVFNHPHWDEMCIGAERHRRLASDFTRRYSAYLHAFEINGLRPWRENRSVLLLAGAAGKPVVAGGDRHALEPNVLLNLTDACTFSEFAEEVRSGLSEVLITPRYLESLTTRILQSIQEILAEHETHGLGWRLWTDRVFYLCDDGETRSLTALFAKDTPFAVTLFTGAVGICRRLRLGSALRFAFPGEEIAF